MGTACEDSTSAWPAMLLGGVVAAGLVLLTQFGYVRGQGGHWAALIRIGETSGARPLFEADFGPVPLAANIGHDGQIMYLQARYFFHADGRPILEQHLDHAEYRSRRILYPALAGGFGLLPPTSILIGLVAWSVVGAFLYGAGVGLLGTQWRLSALTQFIALMNPGLISAGLILGCDCLALGLALLGVALWLRGWPITALAALAAAALTKDTYILFALVLALVELRAGRRRHALALVAGPALPLALWSAFVHFYFQQSLAQGSFNFAFVGVGLVRAAPVWSTLNTELMVQLWLALGLLAGGVAALLLARQPVIFWLAAAYLALGLITSESVWQMPNNALRVLAPLWFCAVLAIGQRMATDQPSLADGSLQ